MAKVHTKTLITASLFVPLPGFGILLTLHHLILLCTVILVKCDQLCAYVLNHNVLNIKSIKLKLILSGAMETRSTYYKEIHKSESQPCQTHPVAWSQKSKCCLGGRDCILSAPSITCWCLCTCVCERG